MKRLFLIFFAWFSLFSLTAQESNSTDSLYHKTLYSDISTASYYELLSWCRDLNLDTKGDAEYLREQLYRNYGLELKTSESSEDSGKTIVKIISADNSQYYNVEETDENYVRISGRVKLIVKQPEENITHTIEADSILFNQSSNTMTASGNIKYTRVENDETEVYSGDNFTFNVNNWKGVILKGDFRKNQKVGENDIEFVFGGESIRKGEGDVVVLDKGSITSEDSETDGTADNAFYHIKAKKIWILGPDEWAILSGVFYVGHVPLFYIPFYHLPGNDLFFNPVIGSENRRGYFIETTMYLLGRKPSSGGESSLFINLADSGESYNLEPEGMYLFKVKGKHDETNPDYIKYKLDYYSRLGAYTGIEGSISKFWNFKDLAFDLGLAVTKSISETSTNSGGYSNYFEENDFNASWNRSDFFGLNLPFRWGLSLDFSLLNFSVSLKYMTDPYFNSDFTSRSEDFNWLNYLLSQTTQKDDPESNSSDTLAWSVQGNLNIPHKWAGDYIKSFSFSPVKLNMSWSSKSNSDYDEPADPSILYDPYSPCRYFFYPDNITWPQTTLNLTGNLLELKTGIDALEPGKVNNNNEKLQIPWEKGENGDSGTTKNNEEENFKKPEIAGDIVVKSDADNYYLKLDYSLTDYFNFISYTDSSLWTSPSDVDFSILKSILTNNNTFNLNYNMNLADKMFSFNDKNTLLFNYKDHSGTITDNELSREKEGRKVTWSNSFNFSFNPFLEYSDFSSSSITYNFVSNLYNYTYDSNLDDYESEWMNWSDDYVTAHKASMTFDYNNTFIHTILSFDTTLPPVDIEQSINPSLEATFFYWTNKLSGKILYSDNEWSLDPATFHSAFNPVDWFNVSTDMTYSFEDSTLTALTGNISLWKFSAAYKMAYTTEYDWDKLNQKLITMGKSFIPDSLNVTFDYNFDSSPLWKNRITMDGDISTKLNVNLQQYNLMSLSFQFSYNLHIFEFLDLSLTLKSTNSHMFLYFPGLRDYYGISGNYNFFTDLLKSFNIFSTDQQDRYDSFFNMDLFELTLIHKLHDWDLELSYSGKPVINTSALTTRWDSTFSFLIRWNPIEKLKIKSDYKDETWNVDTDFDS